MTRGRGWVRARVSGKLVNFRLPRGGQFSVAVDRLDRAPGIEVPGRVSGAETERPDSEVPERARRRAFTAQYKLEMLAAYDAAPEGEKGALLRREGLYSSHIVEWRRARDAGALAGLAAPRGRPWRNARDDRIARLEQEKPPPRCARSRLAGWSGLLS